MMFKAFNHLPGFFNPANDTDICQDISGFSAMKQEQIGTV